LDFKVHSAVGRCKVGGHPLSAHKTLQASARSLKIEVTNDPPWHPCCFSTYQES
jgi:hypothetical protein